MTSDQRLFQFADFPSVITSDHAIFFLSPTIQTLELLVAGKKKSGFAERGCEAATAKPNDG